MVLVSSAYFYELWTGSHLRYHCLFLSWEFFMTMMAALSITAFLIYGTAIRNPRNPLQVSNLHFSNRR